MKSLGPLGVLLGVSNYPYSSPLARLSPVFWPWCFISGQCHTNKPSPGQMSLTFLSSTHLNTKAAYQSMTDARDWYGQRVDFYSESL